MEKIEKKSKKSEKIEKNRKKSEKNRKFSNRYFFVRNGQGGSKMSSGSMVGLVTSKNRTHKAKIKNNRQK